MVLMDPLSERNFQRLASVVQGHTGIHMPPVKRTMAEGRLRRRVRALGLSDVNEYCRLLFDNVALKGGEPEGEFTHLIDAVTTNKTEFFREPEHFAFLRATAVPTLLAEGRRDLKVWSAACSCGAEPFTLAMILADLARRPPAFRFAILGTDISTEVLAQAAAAVYPEEMMAPVPPELRRRYVMGARDPARREVRIVPELRRHVHCRRLNLMDARYPVDRDVDILFCRNILIYFDRPTQEAVLDRLCGHLRPGGYLFLGHSESLSGMALPMRPVAPTIFRKR